MVWQFSFYEGNHLRFRENLHRHRCISVNTGNGHRCENICVISEPYCWIHLLHRKHLRIKDSRIDGAGKGCFVQDPKRPQGAVIFRRDDDILNYHGEFVSESTLDHRYGAQNTSPYAVEISRNRNRFEDGALERSAMACVNSPSHGVAANCRLTTNRERTFCKIKANRDIRNGDELYAGYGNQYWQHNHDNIHFTTRYM